MAWPASITQSFLIGTYSESHLPNTIESTTDHGAKKVRRRFTGAMPTIKGQMLLTTEDQYDDLIDFYYGSESNEGAEFFKFDDQHGDVNKWWRFAKPPVFTNKGQHWLVSIVLEGKVYS